LLVLVMLLLVVVLVQDYAAAQLVSHTLSFLRQGQQV
jgi:hypothetical protein